MTPSSSPAAAGGSPSGAPPATSLWAPLAHPVFRWIWVAAVFSQTGAFMTDVGLGWQIATLSSSPMTVALLATAESLPFFLLSLPAGALADVVDRRHLLIATQGGMVAVSVTLAVVTAMHLMTAPLLLALAGATGIAVAMNNPAWYALPSDVLPRHQLAGGVTLNGVGFNIARVAGPALGGVLVASMGPAAVFTVDAITTTAVIVVLARWRRERAVTVMPAERITGAMKAGLRFARHSAPLRRVLLRAFAFMSCACVVMALLPLLAKETHGGPLAFGLMLGSLGLGAVSGAAVLPRIRQNRSTDAVVGAGSVVFGLACVGMGFLRELWLLCPAFFVAGIAWMSVLSTLNVAAQNVSPSWVRARALAVYLLVFQAGIAGGSAFWGAVATHADLRVAFCAAGAGTALGALLLAGIRLAPDEGADLTPTRHWPPMTIVGKPNPDAGPVVIEIEYRVDIAKAAQFLEAMRAMEPIRRRDGAFEWWLLRDTDDPSKYVEVFAVETWEEHMRQHERVSAADRLVEERVYAFHTGPDRPKTRHLLAADAVTVTTETALPK